VPRVSVAHEQAVRQRIIEAAIKVLGEVGMQRASIQDVVRESGLSVGAIYTHFKNKHELLVIACACEVDHEKADLQRRMAELGSVSDRLATVIDFSVENTVVGAGDNMRARAWMIADDSPDLRQMLRDRRTEMTAFAKLVLQEAVVRGELPAWIDADAVGSAFVTLLDGFMIRTTEADGISIEDARREAYSLLELLVAAPHDRPAAVDALRSGRSQVPA
jgi:AcrR family transcriptional regulator